MLEVAAPQAPDTLVPLLERVLRVAALPRSSAPEEVGKPGRRKLSQDAHVLVHEPRCDVMGFVHQTLRGSTMCLNMACMLLEC